MKKPVRKEPTSCGHCEYDEAEGDLIEQCVRCEAIDMEAFALAEEVGSTSFQPTEKSNG